MIAVETRPELIKAAEKIATDSGFYRMEFVSGKIVETKIGMVDIVTALHACDTMPPTKPSCSALSQRDARYVALVPCCQAELARQLGGGDLDQLWRHPLHRRELGSHITNVLRGLYLEAHGYKVRVTELTGLEHSLKNEFIFAERHQRSNPKAKAEFEKLVREIRAQPKLLALAQISLSLAAPSR